MGGDVDQQSDRGDPSPTRSRRGRDSSAATRERQAHLKASRTERTRVEGAIRNMFDFIEHGVVSARDTDLTVRRAAQRTHRADWEQEIVRVERQLSATDRHATPDAIGRLGDVILRKLRSDDALPRQAYARPVIDQGGARARHDTIGGPIKPLEVTVGEDLDDRPPAGALA